LRYIFWEWIEPIGSALGIALLVMKFVMALYVIPTGSMQPTLHGKGDYPSELGDKVLVNKFIYRFEKPQRWDVIVFEFPYRTITCDRCQNDVMRELPESAPNTIPEGLTCPQPTCQGKPSKLSIIKKDYIKRCVGVPGDELSVRDGSIVLKQEGVWRYSVKTERAQDALWVKVFDDANREQMISLDSYWKGGVALAQWREGSDLAFKADQEETLLFYQKDHLRGHGDKGDRGGPLPMGAPVVGDVKIALEMGVLPTKGLLELEISRNFMPHILELDFSTKALKLKVSDKVLWQGSFSGGSDLSLARVDGQMWLDDNGTIQKFPIPNINIEEITETIVPKLRYKGDAFNIKHLRLYRDIFHQGGSFEFFTGPEQSYKVLPGTYFAMGDNSYHSYDGRMWGPVPEEKLIGKALTVLLPFSRIKLIY